MEEVRQSLTASERPHQDALAIAAAQPRDPKEAPSNRRQPEIDNVSAPTLLPTGKLPSADGDLPDELRRVFDLRRYDAVEVR
jgi:hypothetical protein